MRNNARVAGSGMRPPEVPASGLRSKIDPPLMSGFPFFLLLTFTAVTFLNIPNRFAAVAAVRPTIILVALLTVCIVQQWAVIGSRLTGRESKSLLAIVAYVIFSLPFVAWPGSVLAPNLENFVRSIVFYFFVVAFVDSVERLRVFIRVFVSCQLVRCLEPLILHFTTGYWGGSTYFSGEEMMRLTGAPSDPVNANGLAFVILTTLPFVHYWAAQRRSTFRLCAYVLLVPSLVYALLLTSSRSGLVALGAIVLGLVWFSRHRILLLAVLAVSVMITVPQLTESQRDRYLSLVDHNSKQSATAEGRITAWGSNFDVFLHRPIFGFGLGTSQEANYNVVGDVHYAHNLYLEVLIELGAIGFMFFMVYLVSILVSARDVQRAVVSASNSRDAHTPGILLWLPKSLLVWIAMCLLFSLASYGLSEYQWYLFGGLAVVTSKFAGNLQSSTQLPRDAAVSGIGRRHRSGNFSG